MTWKSVMGSSTTRRTLGSVKKTGRRVHSLWMRAMSAFRDVAGDLIAVLSGHGPNALRHAARSGELSDVVLCSAKFDGFGARIGALLTVKRFADAVGAQFGFAWAESEEVDGIDSARVVFSEQYLRRHLTDLETIASLPIVTTWSPSAVRTVVRHGHGWMHAPRRDRYAIDYRWMKAPAGSSFSDVFQSIGFSADFDALRQAVFRQGSIESAIHLRRGDAFSGDYRIGGKFIERLIPISVTRKLLHQSPERVLIGNADLRTLFPADEQAWTSGMRQSVAFQSFGAPSEGLFRDFCLLASAREIIAGNSSFALSASLIADVSLMEPFDVLGADEIRDVLYQELVVEPMPLDLERVVSSEYFLHFFSGTVGEDDFYAILRMARASDPTNPALLLALVVALLQREGKPAALAHLDAEQHLDSHLNTLISLASNALRVTFGHEFAHISKETGFLRSQDWGYLESLADESDFVALALRAKQLSEGMTDSSALRPHPGRPVTQSLQSSADRLAGVAGAAARGELLVSLGGYEVPPAS